MNKGLIATVVLLAAAASQGATYFVAPTSNNAECLTGPPGSGTPWTCCTGAGTGCTATGTTCTQAAPCDSIEKALAVASSGDTIEVLPGTISTFASVAGDVCGLGLGGTHKYSIYVDTDPGITIKKATLASATPLFTNTGKVAICVDNSANTTIEDLSFNTTGDANSNGRLFGIIGSHNTTLTRIAIAAGRRTVSGWAGDTATLSTVLQSNDVLIREGDFYVGEPGDTAAQRCGNREWVSDFFLKSIGAQRLTMRDNFIHDIGQIATYGSHSVFSVQDDHVWEGNLFMHWTEHGITGGKGARGMVVRNNVFVGRKACVACYHGNCVCGTCDAAAAGACTGSQDQCFRNARAVDFWECPMTPLGNPCIVQNNTFIGNDYQLFSAFQTYSYPSRGCINCEQHNHLFCSGGTKDGSKCGTSAQGIACVNGGGACVAEDCSTPAKKCRDDMVISNNFVHGAGNESGTGNWLSNIRADLDTKAIDYLQIGANWYVLSGTLGRADFICRVDDPEDQQLYDTSTNIIGGCNGASTATCTSALDCVGEGGTEACDDPAPTGFYAWNGDPDCFYADSVNSPAGAGGLDTNPNNALYFANYATGDTGLSTRAAILANYAPASPNAAHIAQGSSGFSRGGCNDNGAYCTIDADCNPGATCSAPKSVPLCASSDINNNARTGTCTPGAWANPGGVGGSCGDGIIDGAEACDPGPDIAGDCCNASCQFEAVSTACDDGLYCYTGSVCTGSSAVCPAGATPLDCDEPDVCTNDTCNEATDTCDHEACTTNDASCSDTTIAWDASTASTALTPASDSYSHTAGAGSDMVAVVFVFGSESTSGDLNDCIPSTVTYDGGAMTIQGSTLATDKGIGTWVGAYTRVLGAGTSGAKTVAITWPNANCDATGSTATTLTGVHQTTPVRLSGSQTAVEDSASLSMILAPLVDGDFIVDGFYHRGSDAGANIDPSVCDQVEKVTTNTAGALHTSVLEADATSETLTWSLSPERTRLVWVAVAFAEAGATSPPSTPAVSITGGSGNIDQ